MDKISIELTVDEANIILEALGQQPFVKVAGLIQKIQQEASAQLQEETVAESPDNSSKAGTTKKKLAATAEASIQNGN